MASATLQRRWFGTSRPSRAALRVTAGATTQRQQSKAPPSAADTPEPGRRALLAAAALAAGGAAAASPPAQAIGFKKELNKRKKIPESEYKEGPQGLK